MQLTVVTWRDAIVNIVVDASTAIEDVKAILEAETQLPAAEQVLVSKGTKILQDG